MNTKIFVRSWLHDCMNCEGETIPRPVLLTPSASMYVALNTSLYMAWIGHRDELGDTINLDAKYAIAPSLVQILSPGPVILAIEAATDCSATVRSEERRVGKECRSRWSPYH